VINKLKEKMRDYFVGKEEVVDDVLVCLLAGGHILLEDVPGVGKTTLARTLAGAVSCDFGRIQFTPDTLPGDVVGTSVYNMKTGEFEYHEGAVMHQVILADEINRTSPKTQASLLEAMEEGQITIDGSVHKLPKPFIVIATQNPVEFLGTYPLPEAQMDRFMMRLSVGYPTEEEEIRLAQNYLKGKMAAAIESVCKSEDIIKAREEVSKVKISDGVLAYIREIVEKTRKDSQLVLGASPRAFLSLIRASQARAYLSGRDYLKPDDVKAVAINVLHHRLVFSSDARKQKSDMDVLIRNLIISVKVPTE